MTRRAAAWTVEVRSSCLGITNERGHHVGRGATLGGLEPLMQEFSNVRDLLIGQAGKRGHAAIRTSGA